MSGPGNRPPRSRRHLFRFVGLAASLAICELLAGLGLHHAARRLGFPDPERYVATDEAVRKARAIHDRGLGWKHRYDTPYGERPRTRDFGRALLATFGDSFVHGDEVAASDTWQELLATELSADVYNFGNPAYGMDQALWRFEEDFPRVATDHVLLGLISPDIERNLTRYWRFLYPDTDLCLTKPRFERSSDGWRRGANPTPSPEDLERLLDPGFVSDLGARDPYFNPFALPQLSPPYLALLARPALWRSAAHGGRPPDPWGNANAVDLVEHILVHFDRIARKAGADPWIVHFPVAWEIGSILHDGTLPPSVLVLRGICARHDLRCLFPYEEMAAQGRYGLQAFFTRGAEGGHYSEEGHAFNAEYLRRELGLARLGERRASRVRVTP